MNRFVGMIKVVGCDNMSWPVDPVTLEATGVGCYDLGAFDYIEKGCLEVVTVGEMNNRRNILWQKQQRERLEEIKHRMIQR